MSAAQLLLTTSLLYALVQIACAVAIGRAFRGSLGGVLGAIGFTVGAVMTVGLYAVGSAILDASKELYAVYAAIGAASLLSLALVLAAFIAGRPAEAGAKDGWATPRAMAFVLGLLVLIVIVFNIFQSPAELR